MRRLILIASTILAAASAPAAAQAPGPDAAVMSITDSAAATAAGLYQAPSESVAAGTSSGLPQRAAPPRTLRAYWHVFIAFALVWILLFGYALSIGRRFGALDAELKRLRGVE